MTGAGSRFRSDTYRQFYSKQLIEHIGRPVSDHGGIGKIVRCFRKITEHLRTIKRTVFQNDNKRLSRSLLALRTAREIEAASSVEQQMSHKDNTVEDLLKLWFASISEEAPRFQITADEFPIDADSTILAWKPDRVSKEESDFRIQRRRINETKYTRYRHGSLLVVLCLSMMSRISQLLKKQRYQQMKYRPLRRRRTDRTNGIHRCSQ